MRRTLLTVLGVSLVAAAVGEHISRRMTQHRYRQEMAGRRQLEQRFSEVLATHEQLTGDLSKERQRAQELSEAIADKRVQLEKAVERLREEAQTIRELQLRLAAMEKQMDQLQGELASVLQEKRGSSTERNAQAVQLERIVVSKSGVLSLQGRVISVHQDWDFVVIDLGWDEVQIGDTVSIFHNDQLQAKARVERVQAEVAAATIMPEWSTAEIRVNDRVQLL